MRIVLPVFALALAAPMPAAAPLVPAKPPQPLPLKTDGTCPYDVAMRHARERGPVRSEKLGELPPADLIHAVARNVDGCLEPVIVRQNIGRR